MRRASVIGQGSRNWVFTALLAAALLATAGLTWETIKSTRSARATADAVLADYSTLAAWQFAGAAERRLNTVLMPVIERTRHDTERHPDRPGETQPDCACPRALPALTSFRLSANGAETTTGAPLTAATRAAAQQALADAAAGSTRVVTVADGGAPRAIVLHKAMGGPDGPRVFGAVIAADQIGGVFASVFSSTQLLPRALIGDASSAETFAVRVSDDAGTSWFSSGAEPARYAGSATMSPLASGLRIDASVHPDRAGSLVIGGLPAARWPVALALLALAAGLVMLALLQMRREVRFARRQADFVSGVSHELRTPLAQIRLYGETLQLGRVRSAEEGRRAAEIIVQESRRLGALVDTVLLFSRISRQRVTIRRDPTDLGSLARDVVESFRPFAAAKDATVVLESHGHDAVAIDRDACRQILLNLLDNAVKFGPIGQTIRVVVEAADAQVTLAVQDEGPGVAREHASRIWDAFWRAPGSSEGGSGLGLSIVRELARRHGGDAIVDEARARGAGFVVTLSTGPARPADDRRAIVPA